MEGEVALTTAGVAALTTAQVAALTTAQVAALKPAQIAALADCHLLIQKNITNERTYTEIHPLDENGRVEALARLISGDHVTELSLANAREMLGWSAGK